MKARGAVACGHPATAEAAAQVLAAGGNAFDAVLAAFGAATVAETVLASLAGGGFLLAKPHDGDPLVYDFFVDTPLASRPPEELDFFPVHADFGTATQEFHIGLGATATPGGVKGLFAVHRDLATLPMTEILAPAIALARDGYAIREFDHFLFTVVDPILKARDEVRALHCDADGHFLRPGAVMKQPALADSLEALAGEGEALFYQGELGRRLVEMCRERGGLITADDLRHYQVERRPALRRGYRGAEILTNPPPSAGGILIALALDLLEAQDPRLLDAAERTGVLARVMALVGDIRRETGLETLLAGAPAQAEQALGDPALLARYRAEVLSHPASHRGTTHISVVDAHGNLAAMTLSNGEGCAEFLPGSGIILNNMLGEEDLNPRGFHQAVAGKRLSSMMAPTLALLPGGAITAMGSGGSNRIRSAILQVLLGLIDQQLTLAEAIAAPRLHVERGKANLEQGLPRHFLDSSLEIVEWPAGNLFFGGAHGVERRADGSFEAFGDPRRHGVGRIVD